MRFLKPAAQVAATVGALAIIGLAQAQNAAVVNGVPIPQARMDFVMKMQSGQQGFKDTEESRKQLKEALITREIIAQEAAKKGLDKSPEYQTQMDLARQQVLVNAFFEDYLKKSEPTEADVRKEYDRVKAEQFNAGNKEYKTRHILVKKEADAKAIMAQLAKGAKFEDIAKKKSEDSGSKAKGGELDWTDGSNLVKPYAEAMKALKKGEMTKAPVQTQYGYHIIRVDDVRDPQFPPFEDVKDQVSKQLLAKQRDEMIDSLRKKAKVE